ncbi:hypothetical protein ACHWQZ_G016082 [Mnemiopsis leidyi]
MALSTLRLRESQVAQPGIRQYADKAARPSPHDLQEVLALSKGLRKLKVTEKPDFIPKKPVLPGISKSDTVQFTDCDEIEIDPELDEICKGVSEEGVKGFLKKSQVMLNVLHHWWWEGTNSLEFLNWWFTKLGLEQRVDWFKLECSILLEEISSSIETRVSRQKVMEFLLTILHEHPSQFCSETETNRLPDMIETLVAGDKRRYCGLLSHVKCKTSKQETVLALRTYTVIGICYAAVSFYRKLVTEKIHAENRPTSRSRTGMLSREKTIRPGSSSGRPGSSRGRPGSAVSPESRPTTAQNIDRVEQHNIGRAFDAVLCGFVEVLKYMFDKGYIDRSITDNQGRSLIFVATLYKQHAVLNFLLSDTDLSPIDVNRVADNGNTPLHVASSAGNSLALNILLKSGADPHLFNPESNGATPLHLAVLQDNIDCVVLLLGAGADPLIRMGCPADTSAIELAKQLDHSDILKLLIGAVEVRPGSALYVEGMELDE